MSICAWGIYFILIPYIVMLLILLYYFYHYKNKFLLTKCLFALIKYSLSSWLLLKYSLNILWVCFGENVKNQNYKANEVTGSISQYCALYQFALMIVCAFVCDSKHTYWSFISISKKKFFCIVFIRIFYWFVRSDNRISRVFIMHLQLLLCNSFCLNSSTNFWLIILGYRFKKIPFFLVFATITNLNVESSI